MTNGIYGYYDTKNQYVVYIGQDSYINEEKRHKEHLSPSHYDIQHINRILQSNPNRYTYFKLVEGNYTQDEIDDFEKEAIKLFKTYKYDYPKRNVFNFTPGGDFVPTRVPEIVQKISKSMSGENHPFYGKHHSEKTKEKISKANTGRKHSEKTRKKMSTNNARYWLGKSIPESTKEKMRQNHVGMQGKHHSQEARDKIGQSNKGKKRSDDFKMYMSVIQNTTGYYRVTVQKNDAFKQGYRWVYQYRENGKHKAISSVDIKKLEKKVKDKGLKWEKIK